MGTKTARNDITRERWKAFLLPLVGRNRPVSIAKLGEKLAGLTRHTGDLRADVYAYLGGRQTVTPERAFFVGEALHASDIAWCSGPIALYAAGYFTEFVSLIANLTLDSLDADRCDLAVAIALLAPLSQSAAPPNEAFEGFTAAARQLLENAYADLGSDAIRWAFQREATSGWNPYLKSLGQTARSNASWDDIEWSVHNTFVKWGLSVASQSLRAGLIDDVVAYEHARLDKLKSETIARDALVPR